MPHTVSWFGRLRIERVVWTLDFFLVDLPRRSRIEKRRDLRRNLVAAAEDIGTSEALRQLGGTTQLAHEYMSAEFGDRPRHSWLAAGMFAATTMLVATSLFSEAAFAFRDGVTAANPDAAGTFTWDGIPYLQNTVTFTFGNGTPTFAGGGFAPIFWVLWIVGTVLVGRLWRVVSRRLRGNPAAVS